MEPILKGPTTLAVILGASDFPKSPLSAPPSFKNSAEAFKSFLLDTFHLPQDNLADLFDTEEWPGALLEQIELFIRNRKKCGATDLIFYYVGHGAETSADRKFYLAIRSTREGAESSSSIICSDLSSGLCREGTGLRFYIILDCCFSAAAYQDFQAAPLEAVTIQTREELPKKGTVLFCAASRRDVALAPAGETYTRFSDALLTALQEGDPLADEYLSFADLGRRVEAILRDRHPEDLTRPQLQAPNAREGDIAGLTAFPNRAYRAAPAQYEYFTRFVRRRGVPEGIGQISEEQARLRHRSTRITREKGRVRKVEIINGPGFLAPSFYSSGYLQAAAKGPEEQTRECLWEFSYDERERVAVEEVSNAAGRVVYRCAYSAAGENNSVAHYFLNPSDIVHPQTKSGATFVKIFRDENGFDKRFEFFDGLDQEQPDDLGSFGRECEIGKQGLEIRLKQLGRELKPGICKENYAIAEYSYDSNGNLTSQSYLDADGTPTLHEEGYQRAAFQWGSEGNWIGTRLFGLDNEPVLSKSGFASWTAAYDGIGNQTRNDFFGADNKPIIVKDGYASWVAEYDDCGRVTSTQFLDTNGEPTRSGDGIAKWICKYDGAGNVIF